MKKSLENFIGSLKQIRLTEEEKVSIATTLGFSVRNRSDARLQSHRESMNTEQFLALAQGVRLSPAEHVLIKEAILEKASESGSSWILGFKRLTSVVASVLIVTTAGGALAYAAEDSLPGDFLYPLKIHVTEAVRAGLQRTPGEATEWESERAERRLREAEELAARGTLSEEASEGIRVRFLQHAVRVREGMMILAKTDADLPGAQAIGAEFEAGMNAHLKALMLIKHEGSAPNKAFDSLLTDIEDARIETEAVTLDASLEGNSEASAKNLPVILQHVRRRLEEAKKNGDKERVLSAAAALRKAEEASSEAPEEGVRLARQALREVREAGLRALYRKQERQAEDLLQNQNRSASENAVFQTKVRMHMTDRNIEKTHKLIRGLKKPLSEDFSIGVESRLGGAQELQNLSRKQLDAGEASSALESADSALRNAREAQKNVETEIGIGGE